MAARKKSVASSSAKIWKFMLRICRLAFSWSWTQDQLGPRLLAAFLRKRLLTKICQDLLAKVMIISWCFIDICFFWHPHYLCMIFSFQGLQHVSNESRRSLYNSNIRTKMNRWDELGCKMCRPHSRNAQHARWNFDWMVTVENFGLQDHVRWPACLTRSFISAQKAYEATGLLDPGQGISEDVLSTYRETSDEYFSW